MELSETRTSSPGEALSFPSAGQPAVALDRLAVRVLDCVVAATVLAITAPLLLVIAVLVRATSPGPALFVQRRVGRDRTAFSLIKFRTMRAGGGDAPHRDYVRSLITAPATTAGAAAGELHKLTADTRITSVGRVLRSWSLDELPQLINVLRGEMSLVGPRPVIDYEAELFPQTCAARFDVKPGLTGLWQVSGRNACSYQEMLALDVTYAQQRSFRGDVMILLRTIPVVLGRRGVA